MAVPRKRQRLVLYTPAQNLAWAGYESIGWRDDFCDCGAAW